MTINPGMARRLMQLRASTPVTLSWIEYPSDSKADPTAGNYEVEGTEQTVSFNAFVHFPSIASNAVHVFGEVETGDCIIDIPVTFYRITNPGGTSFTVGQVVSESSLRLANYALVSELLAATGDVVDLKTLKNATATIAGEKWVQKPVGKELSQSWDAIVGTVKLCQSLLLRKAV